MDCNHARLLLIFSRNRSELEASEALALQGHLDHCSECEAWARAERGTDEPLGKAMRAVPVPPGLQSRLLVRLRHDRSVRRWRRVLAGGAMAAALLLTAGVAWVWFKTPPELTLEAVETELSEKVAASPDKVDQWFKDLGLPIEAPRQFNYGMLYSYGMAQFSNRRVPRLLFVRGDGDRAAVAEVYVLSEAQFDLTQLKKNLPHSNSSHMFQALEDSPRGYLFLAVFTGGSLRTFIVNPDGA